MALSNAERQRLYRERQRHKNLYTIKVKGEDGNYLVETLENGYSITKEGEETSMQLLYDAATSTWNVTSEDVTTELLKINGDGTAQMTLPNGEGLTVTLDEQGVSTARQLTMTNTYFAAK